MEGEITVSAVTAPTPALLIRLKPTGPWRMGPDSGSRDRVDRILHSDSLYSALTLAMVQLGFADEWLAATAGQSNKPEVCISSVFPFQGDRFYVVPPQHLWPPSSLHSSRVRWKGAKFVPLAVVRSLTAGKTLADDAWTVDPVSECLLPQGQGSGPFRTALRSSAAIDRTGLGAASHTTACLEFAPGAGLWFVAAFSGNDGRRNWSSRVQAALRLLADTGLGGERSRGWGRFELEPVEDRPLHQLLNIGSVNADQAQGHWLLSLFQPSQSDAVDWGQGHYSLVTRSGRAEGSRDWLKKPARMVAEGSVLVADGQLTGSAENVAPEGFAHPVYRAGFAVSIPVPLRPIS